MKISYTITVCKELAEIQQLLPALLKAKREEDEVVVLYDLNGGTPEMEEYLTSMKDSITFGMGHFEKHFADWKNKLKDFCTGDYIINIDADELPSPAFLNNIVEVLTENPEMDMLVVPRWNEVIGLKDHHIRQWGWRLDEHNRVNWPDYQMRVYKNSKDIVWINPVHEILTGFQTFAPLPDEMYFSHIKQIEKQEKQNSLYNTI